MLQQRQADDARYLARPSGDLLRRILDDEFQRSLRL